MTEPSLARAFEGPPGRTAAIPAARTLLLTRLADASCRRLLPPRPAFSAPYAEEVKWLISCDMGMRHCLADGVTAVDLVSV
jgi:hypothetical protein